MYMIIKLYYCKEEGKGERVVNIPYEYTFKPHRAAKHLKCSKLIRNSTYYTPVVIEDSNTLDISCKDIRKRGNFVNKTYEDEADFPLAFVRAVFRDYEYLEADLSTHYNPNNVYCYVMDSKADAKFKARLRALSTCFPNVIVADKEFKMSSKGRNVNPAQYHCLERLLDRNWKYVMLLEELNITKLMKILNKDYYEHEQLTSTLNANEVLKVPGGFTTKFLYKLNYSHMTRYTHWGSQNCNSKHIRNNVCVYKMPDLRDRLMTMPEFIYNKMMPSVDFGAINCWHEYMFNRTHIHRNTTVNEELYRNLPPVQWHNGRNVVISK
ncbi:unnamed protein product [Bursaphelenchus okinawaensis]|uniref:Uncharacterized protein n=1 Tax=Bursaphelenchus okinawaensis TaxID=465554 RepID=A0A811KAT1_9BILA|nr:unnamed protein product [Bursaphelenchus okinawaensis]CAG9096263.1 unnamed protein product [Bursaphelenchus okinawaensis]